MKRFLSMILILILTISILAVPASADSSKDLAEVAKGTAGKSKSDLGLPSGDWCCYFIGYCINNSIVHSWAEEKISIADSKNPMTLINWTCAKKKIGTYYSFSSTHYNRLINKYKNLSIVSTSINDFTPIAGDILIVDWKGREDREHYFSHAGIVTSYNTNLRTVTFVDGNSDAGKRVYVREGKWGPSNSVYNDIIGYIRLNRQSPPIIPPLTDIDEGPASTLEITATAYPTGTLKQGSRYSLKGTVTSNFNITSVKGEIIDSSGNAVFSYTQRPNARSFSILNSTLDANMKFNELPPGRYYLRYTAVDERGKSVEWYSNTFEIQGEQRERFATVTFDPEGGSVNQRTKTVAAGELIGALPVPVREGYDFAGWATGRSSSMIVEPDNYWVEEDATLYARWRPKPMEEPPAQEDPDVEDTEPVPEPEPEPEPAGHWGEWSEWGYIPVSASETRQVETDQIKVSEAYTEYRYGRYIDPTGKHNCWCATYLEGLFKGAAREQYSSWSRTRYSASGTGWSCGNCRGNHRGVDHTGSDGRDWWAEYVLPNGHYYWEESKTVPAEYETQYRYRDWIYG